jgi:uncharacterized protein YjbI with pentapeptide repeats
MKKLLLSLLFLGYLGTASADIVEINVSKLREFNICKSCNLVGADLSGTDLSVADLSGADLSGADLWNTNLSKADLSGADFTGAIFNNANISEVTFCNTKLPWGIDDSGC